jgi:hypothetical protein
MFGTNLPKSVYPEHPSGLVIGPSSPSSSSSPLFGCCLLWWFQQQIAAPQETEQTSFFLSDCSNIIAFSLSLSLSFSLSLSLSLLWQRGRFASSPSFSR